MAKYNVTEKVFITQKLMNEYRVLRESRLIAESKIRREYKKREDEIEGQIKVMIQAKIPIEKGDLEAFLQVSSRKYPDFRGWIETHVGIEKVQEILDNTEAPTQLVVRQKI